LNLEFSSAPTGGPWGLYIEFLSKQKQALAPSEVTGITAEKSFGQHFRINMDICCYVDDIRIMKIKTYIVEIGRPSIHRRNIGRHINGGIEEGPVFERDYQSGSVYEKDPKHWKRKEKN
jgi:hypothetical protein